MISQKHALTLFAVAAAALLTIVATIPAVQATSLAPGIMPEVDDDSTSSSVVSAALSRDEITFLEDNWYFDSGALQPESSVDTPVIRSLTQEKIAFLEANWHLGIGDIVDPTEQNDSEASERSSTNNLDRADSINENQEGDQTAEQGSTSENSLTHPWGGDSLTPNY